MEVAKKAFFFTRDSLLYILGSCCQKSKTQPDIARDGTNLIFQSLIFLLHHPHHHVVEYQRSGSEHFEPHHLAVNL